MSLAFFDELPHAEVASVLGAPVGTVKTRIRLSMKRLAPILAALVVVVAVAILGWRLGERDEGDERRARDERALRMVTASDVVPLRLSAADGVPAAAHGSYRARPGVRVAVLTTTALPPPDSGARYLAWTRHGAAWVSLGSVEIGEDGRSLTVGEDDALATPPDEVRVTRETTAPGGTPGGATVLSWPTAR